MIKGTPSRDAVVKILDRLSSDNDFREHFLGDPAGALKEYGVEVDPAQVPAVRKLPSKEQLAAMRTQAAGEENPTDRLGLAFLLR